MIQEIYHLDPGLISDIHHTICLRTLLSIGWPYREAAEFSQYPKASTCRQTPLGEIGRCRISCPKEKSVMFFFQNWWEIHNRSLSFIMNLWPSKNVPAFLVRKAFQVVYSLFVATKTNGWNPKIGGFEGSTSEAWMSLPWAPGHPQQPTFNNNTRKIRESGKTGALDVASLTWRHDFWVGHDFFLPDDDFLRHPSI